MAIGLKNEDPIVADRVLLEVVACEIADSKFKTDDGHERKQFAVELRVISGAKGRDDESFLAWFAFRPDRDISTRLKAGQLLAAALGKNAYADTLDGLATKLIGTRFTAQLVASDAGYTRVKDGTIDAVNAADDEEFVI